MERRIDYRSTILIVSSKSGTTLEPNILKQYVFERAKQELGIARKKPTRPSAPHSVVGPCMCSTTAYRS